MTKPLVRAGREFPVAAILVATLRSAALASESIQVPQHGLLEIAFEAQQSSPDPFGEPLFVVEVTPPKGPPRQIEGFFDGDGKGGQEGKIWKARLCPDLPGIWTWNTHEQISSAMSSAEIQGTFECIPNPEPIALAARGRSFELQGAGPLYLVGNFLDQAHGFRSTHILLAESTPEAQRRRILERQRDLHDANFVNFYLANRGDYASQSVTPWVGNKKKNDKSRFDLSRWKMYDEWIERAGGEHMLVCLWFFADDSGFGSLSREDRERFLRYAMARTSAFAHTFYILGLEYEEAFTDDVMREMGTFLSEHNPWSRLVSTHLVGGGGWNFDGERWAHFIASQVGNFTTAERVNGHVRKFRREYSSPHLHVEFGILRADQNSDLRQRTWANLCGGAAGGGTGSGLKSLQRFLRESRVPFQRMAPSNDLVNQGGMRRFCLAERGHHYLVYSLSGSVTVRVAGENLRGAWYDPRDPESKLELTLAVEPGDQTFTPPDPSRDWVLWISDGSNLNTGRTHPASLPPIVRTMARAAVADSVPSR